MMWALLKVRFRALFAGMMRQNRKKGKKTGVGMVILFAFLYLYIGVVLCGVMAMLFSALAGTYHAANLDWLYFSMAGTMGLGMAVIGSVFTTQSQLYDARDNDLLLAMPIPPGKILMSRMIPLLTLNLLFAAIVMVPAVVVYAVMVGFSPLGLIIQILSILAIALLAQGIACLLGWLLHLLLSKINKSMASLIYMIVFLALYWGIYSQAGEILTALAENGALLANVMQTWVWPLYAMGVGSTGNILMAACFIAICCVVFLLVWWLLSMTFLRSATTRKGSKKRRLNTAKIQAASPSRAIVRKELQRFLGCPVYLTNMGLGIVFVAVLTVAGLILRNTLLSSLGPLASMLRSYYPLIIAVILGFTASLVCISTPSISLEGKHLWILKSLPVSSRAILQGKLKFHCLLATPITLAAGIILGIGYGCNLWEAFLAGLAPALLTVVSGLLGLICDLKWARFDWISEAYPCKQSVSVLIVMFSMMGVPIVLGICFFLLESILSSTVFLLMASAVLGLVCLGLYRVLIHWGIRRWDEL